jgi:hypothetical protein
MASSCDCPVDPRTMLKQTQCLYTLSKDLRGEVGEPEAERRQCRETECMTLTTVQPLRVEVTSHDCDSRIGLLLDGKFEVQDLVHVFDGDGSRRGIHSGTFRWASAGGLIIGELSGVTNAGTHRPNVMECQSCKAPGFLQGQLCGTVVKVRDKSLRDAYVFGEYLLHLREPNGDGFKAQDVIGTLEGVVGVPCHD